MQFILERTGRGSKFVSSLEVGESVLIIGCIFSQQVTFRADKQVRKTNHLLKGVAMGDVGPNEECSWEDEVKNIPPVPPSRLGGGCKNIEVKYILSVSGSRSTKKQESRCTVDDVAKVVCC